MSAPSTLRLTQRELALERERDALLVERVRLQRRVDALGLALLALTIHSEPHMPADGSAYRGWHAAWRRAREMLALEQLLPAAAGRRAPASTDG